MAEENMKIEEIPQLTDEKLKEALDHFGEAVGPITSSTRKVLEGLLMRRLEGKAAETPDNDVVGGIVVSGRSQKVFPEENARSLTSALNNSEASVFFGVFLPESLDITTNDPDFQKVYIDKTACLAVMKKYRGSRFKAFRTYEEALQFAENGPAVVISQCAAAAGEVGGSSTSISAEKPSPFRGPKSQDLVKFRKSIEKGDMEYFSQCIDENPRYLVSSGDTPAILQEGFRYNALHVACRTNKPKFVAKILLTVARAEFFQRLYPDDAFESSERRSTFLLDLYLNTPDKGLNETPLHFASKHGCVDCVRELTSYAVCDKCRNNKFAQKPVDIVCSRMKESTSNVATEICNLLGEQVYIPLLRDDEHCLLPQVGNPWSPQFDSPTSPITMDQLLVTCHSSVSPASPISPSFKVRGYAGPMSPSQAEVFHRLWKNTTTPSPTRHSKGRIASIRLTDQEKGLERMGRELAAERRVGWTEYWDFLGDFANLSSDEGLLKLETFLREKYKQFMLERGVLDASDLANRLGEVHQASEDMKDTNHEIQGDSSNAELNVSDLSKSSRSTMSELCQELEALRLNASLSPQSDTVEPDIISASSKFLESCRPREEKSVSGENELRKTVEQEAAAQQLSYIIKSVDVAAHRMADVMGDLAKDLQSSTVAKLSVTKTVRTKLRPEILCLKNVVSKCCTKELKNDREFGFIHILLASKISEFIQQNLIPSDMCVLAETMKIFVSHLNFVQFDSSDEEGITKPDVKETCKQNDANHCSCVLQCLEKALNIACINFSTDLDVKDNENVKLHLMQIGECTCHWSTSAGITQSDISNPTPVSTTKYAKAFNFLHETLFSEKRKDMKDNITDNTVVKKLSFTEDEGKDERNTAPFDVIDGADVSQNAITGVKNEVNDEQAGLCTTLDEEISEKDNDNDSFATAASSIEDIMVTPEEGVKVFINGLEASKVDVDVLGAVGDREVDGTKYPHVFQWRHLINSYSEAQRDSWLSPYCSQVQRSSAPSSAPSKLSHPNTPARHHTWIPSSTPRVLFRKNNEPQDASPL